MNYYDIINVLHHTIPYKLCRFEMKDMHGLQRFSSTDSDESENLLFMFCLKKKKRNFLITFYCSEQNSAIFCLVLPGTDCGV